LRPIRGIDGRAVQNNGRRLVHAFVTSFASWIVNEVRSIAADYYREQARRKGIQLLQKMDDHMLHDIGISRCDIPRIVRYGRRSIESNELAPNNSDHQQSVRTIGIRTGERNEVRSFAIAGTC